LAMPSASKLEFGLLAKLSNFGPVLQDFFFTA
jgi:hypothetical protein